MQLEDFYADPNPLAAHYRCFRVAERLLLTGHSHQAWPDRGLKGQIQAWADAAGHLDRKWELASQKAEDVRRGFARLLDDTEGHYALAASTHDLVARLLSALPFARRRRIVTTDSEFHSVSRQLARLEEEGVEVFRVPAHPCDDLDGRLVDALDDRTAALIVSAVFLNSGQIAPGLDALPAACERSGTVLLVDVYHALNVVPLSLRELGLQNAYVVGGGYKYCQLGEGCCFLRFPKDCSLRPVLTGWFADFEGLEAPPGGVVYGEGPARFAGSTYDPTSHYRAAEVFAFFEEHGLEPRLLRHVSQHQVGLLCALFDALDLPPGFIFRDQSVPLERLGGFLALQSPDAAEICKRLGHAGVLADSRGDVLRLGPAPYLSDRQLTEAVGILGEVARSLLSRSPGAVEPGTTLGR